jgi:hypothetical protein
MKKNLRFTGAVAAGLSVGAPAVLRAAVEPIRVVTYNIAADVTTGVTTVNDTLFSTVAAGLGNEAFAGFARPADILCLQETYSNAATVAPIINDLNTLYPGLSYAQSPLQLAIGGYSAVIGDGPNAIVYNTKTLQLVTSVAVGTATLEGNEYYRQEGRYTFAPVGVNPSATNEFYVYVGHYKSGTGTDNETLRDQEAQFIRTDADTLPSGARILEIGDFNLSNSSEPAYVTLTNASSSSNGSSHYTTGSQVFDPINMPGNWSSSSKTSPFLGILSDSSSAIHLRTDLILPTQNVLTDPTGLNYIPGSYSAFGNNGSLPYDTSVSNSSNTALTGLPNRTAVLNALPVVTDHLPVVADFNLVTTAPNVQWVPTSGGSWNSAVNWTPDWVPNTASAVANFPTGSVVNAMVTLDGSRTVGKLIFGNSGGYTIAQGTGGTLTIDDTGDTAGVNPSITVSAGNHVITAPLSIASGVTVTTATATSLTIGGSVTGTGPFTIGGAGTTLLSTAGSLGLAVTVNGSLNVVANPRSTILARTFAGLNVGATGDVAVAASATRSVVVTSALSIATGGTLDLTSNDLIVSGGDIGAVTALAATGFNLAGGGNWSGSGLTSSLAASDTTHLTALAVVGNNQGGPTLDGKFDGVSVNPGDVLVKYTLVGDANLDGHVDGSDYTLIDTGFASGGTLTGWFNGDFNYDGYVDGSDYALIDNSFNNQPAAGIPSVLTAEVSAQPASAPEPASLSLLTALLLPIARRRRSV